MLADGTRNNAAQTPPARRILSPQGTPDSRRLLRGMLMKSRRLFPAFLLFAFAITICGQVRPDEVDSLLKGASNALDHWRQLAPGIHCEEATQQDFRDACKIDLETMKGRVQESNAEIARYRQQSTPQVVDLFDAYESFGKVWEIVEGMSRAADSYGEQNRQVLVDAYNTFVKVNGWFGAVMRASIQDAAKCSDHGHT